MVVGVSEEDVLGGSRGREHEGADGGAEEQFFHGFPRIRRRSGRVGGDPTPGRAGVALKKFM